jgi:signal peptidase I
MKHWFKENRSLLVFLLCFGFFRLAVADWNPIPSGSMRPTLLEGDVVLVDRLAYDLKIPLTDIAVLELGTPQRGDVVVFRSPHDGMRLIKRLVALPGDIVEMREEVLFLNGEPADYVDAVQVREPVADDISLPALRLTERSAGSARQVQFLPDVRALRSFGPLIVPADSYFFLGDNRDNSGDSRYFGSVPRHLLSGRAHHILASADIKGNWLPRLERFGEPLR